ncbi:MAG: MBOAT family O-acyltransferase [Lachnospiraceae bacterium]
MKNFILFIGSLIFYAWGEPIYVTLMLFSTVSDFLHGKKIEHNLLLGKKRNARIWLISSITINILVLGFFKYSDFLITIINNSTNSTIPLLNLALPIGISFYTFQTMSYTIDVYKKEVKAQNKIIDFGMFVTMFPQLIAGPIVKYKTIAPQIEERNSNIDHICDGMKRFLIGLSKKVLLANQIGLLWEEIQVLSNPSVLSSWMGVIAFGLQLYFDFSGYSDMAIGLGHIFGFTIPENFNYPYMAKSVTEFWRKWHISLSSWFKEYLYIPLGGNKGGAIKQYRNIVIVWLITGLWHGASWNFILWGMWFAIFLFIEKWLGERIEIIPRFLRHLYTLFVVFTSWAIFSITELSQVIEVLKNMFLCNGALLYNTEDFYRISNYWFLFLLLIIGSTNYPKKLVVFFEKKIPSIVYCGIEYVIFIAMLLITIAYIIGSSYNPFLYFIF